MTIFFALVLTASVVAAVILIRGTRSMGRLADVPIDQVQPPLSVVVAARNEAHTIEPALRSLLAQDYRDLELIVVDDRSSDDTAAIVDRIARDHPTLEVLHVDQLPDGWLGKNHALQVGAQQARGQYILFTDADVVMHPSTLARAVSYCRQHELSHLAVLPDMPISDYWADGFFAEFALDGALALQSWRMLNQHDGVTMGIGAFNLVTAAAYRAIDGHQRIRLRADDDYVLARVLQKAGFKQDLLIGRGMVVVEWYTGLREGIRSVEKNALAPFNYSLWPLLAAMAAHFIWAVVPWLGLFLGSTVRPLAAGAILARAAAWVSNARVTGRGLKYAAAMLVTALLFEYSMLRAAGIILLQGGIRWRDTFYPLAQLRTNRI